ncbi:MAG: hypothetical protein ACHQET_07065 [Chitinophagales bacterium]
MLPKDIAEALQLSDNTGNPVLIVNENKMQLEWLVQKINALFNAQDRSLTVFKTKLKRKKTITFFVLILSALVVKFSQPISSLLGTSRIPVNFCGLSIAIISFLQLLKYIAQGFSGPSTRFADTNEAADLRETILKNFVN